MEALRPVFENLNGSLHSIWFAFGEYDLVMICQLPDNMSVAAISMAVSAGDAIRSVKTTPLMTMEEGINAMKMATKTVYKPPTS